MKKIVLWIGMSLIAMGSVLSFSATVNNDSAIYNGREFYRGMGQVRFVSAENAEKLTIEAQTEKVNAYLAQYDEALKIGDIYVYDDSETYFIIYEEETGKGAMELLVDPYSGYVFPEYGPNMMWNLKYGMMYGGRGLAGQEGMMFGYQNFNVNGFACGGQSGYYNSMMGIQSNINPDTDTLLTEEEVLKIANDYIAKLELSKSVLNVETHEFYGYYTVHLMAQDDMLGMFSINAYTGDVWYHSWHGTLSEMIEND